MTEMSKKPILNAVILIGMLMVMLISAFDLSLTVLLGYVDFVRCWDAIGTGVRYASVDNLPYLESIEVASEYYDIGMFYSYLIYLINYIPMIITGVLASKTKTKFYVLLFTTLFSLYFCLSIDTPSDLHQCDRNGSEGIYILVFTPLVLFIPLSLLGWVTLKYYNKR